MKQVCAQTPVIGVDPTTLDFGSPDIGQSVTKTLTVSNTGTAPLFIIFNLGLPAPPFSVDPQVVGGFIIPPKETRAITVTFLSQDLADHNDVLKFSHSDLNTPSISVPLHGQAQGGPNIVVDPTALSFGDVTVGQNAFHTLTVDNTGTSALTVSALSSTNPLFRVIAPTTVPFTVTPDATPFPVTVLFRPTFDGVHTGQLGITSNDPDLATVVITLQGTGTGGVPNFAEGQGGLLDFGSVCVGSSVTRTLTVTNTGTGTLIVTSIGISPNFRVTGPGVPFQVPPHAPPVTMTILFSPDRDGPVIPTGGITIFSNDPDLSFANRVFHGAGIQPGTPCSGRCCEEHECGGCRPGFCIKPPQQCQ